MLFGLLIFASRRKTAEEGELPGRTDGEVHFGNASHSSALHGRGCREPPASLHMTDSILVKQILAYYPTFVVDAPFKNLFRWLLRLHLLLRRGSLYFTVNSNANVVPGTYSEKRESARVEFGLVATDADSVRAIIHVTTAAAQTLHSHPPPAPMSVPDVAPFPDAAAAALPRALFFARLVPCDRDRLREG